MDRRSFVAGSFAAALLRGGSALAAEVTANPNAPTAFDPQTVRSLAKNLAASPFKAGDRSFPKELEGLDYDAYRTIRFQRDRSLWRGEGLPFEIQYFHRGFIFADRVDIYEVANGTAKPIVYSPQLFDFGKVKPVPEGTDVGFAGFRIHYPLNRPEYYDEVGVFLGATYFRAVAKGEVYGLSARGLALHTGDSRGEEFPAFKKFWIEKPGKQANSIVVHALVDSKSAAGAYRFTIRPGNPTIYDVEMTLYPRADLDDVGVGANTSMFLFDTNDRAGVDDFRSAVHDSDGLAMRNGRGEEIWRPLTNPRDLQTSVFSDVNPRGFGLLQRERDFSAYQDLESHFEKRPSLWVEPIGDWGEGAVALFEIPTKEEIHDNIVAFWRPKSVLKAKGEYNFTYRLHWGPAEVNRPPLARFVKTREGAGADDSRLFVLDVVGDNLKNLDPATVRAEVSKDKGEIRNVVLRPNEAIGGWRVSFELATKKETAIELRAQLLRQDEGLSEVWVYRWAP